MGSRRGVHTGYTLDAETAQQIEELAAVTRRSKTAVVEVAIEELYRQRETGAGDEKAGRG